MILGSSASGICSEYNLEQYVAPLPGATYFYESPNGLTMEVRSRRIDPKTIEVSETICCVETGNGELPSPIQGRYILYATDTRIIQSAPSGNTTLVDMSTDSWSNPVRTFGDVAETGLSSECRIVSSGKTMILGKERSFIKVESRIQPANRTPIVHTWTLVSELGLLSKGDLKLVRIVTD